MSDPRLRREVSDPGPIELLRLFSLRGMNDCVEQYHVFSKRCETVEELTAAFNQYRSAVLSMLRLRIEASADRIEADVLSVDVATLALKMDAGTANYEKFVPADMRLIIDDDSGYLVDPAREAGVATYAIWAFAVGNPGVALAQDVHTSTDIDYFSEARANEDRALGWYERQSVEGMYRPVPGTLVPPPYRSLLSTAIPVVRRASRDPEWEVELQCIGALNVTHTAPNAFGLGDCAWAQTCASLLGSLYECFHSRSRELADRIQSI